MKSSTEGFDSLLAELSAGSQLYFGDGHAVIQPVQRLERPYSALLRLRVEAAGHESYAFLKVFKPRGGSAEEVAQLRRFVEREYRSTHHLHEALRDRTDLTALRPVAVFPDQLALVTEEVRGETFAVVARRGLLGGGAANDAVAVAERIGAWIRTYQEVTAADGLLSLDAQREYIDVRLRKLAGHALSEQERQDALRKFDTIAAGIDGGDLGLVAIHADLTPTNILVAPDGRVTIVDFAMAKTGARYHDVAHLYLHLERLPGRVPLRAVRGEVLQAALLRGVSPTLSASHPLFALMLLQHVVCIVAQLAQREVGVLGPAYRMLLRHRWKQGLQSLASAERG
jgi:hypothetical protein